MMRKIGVVSAKGGSGKTTISLSLAFSLAEEGKKVGVLDCDVSTPDCQHFLEITRDWEITKKEGGKICIVPARARAEGFEGEIEFFSFSLVASSAFIWNEKRMMRSLDDAFSSLLWSADVVIIDTPPTISPDFVKAMKFIDAAIIVSLPDELGMKDAQRCLSVLSHFDVPVIGYILNMTSFKCECGREIQIFPRSSLELPIPKLGEVPISLNHSLVHLPFSSQILTLPARRMKKRRRLLSLLKLVSGRWSM